jgi:hypothetical protein
MSNAIPYKDVNKSGDLVTKNFYNTNSVSVTTETKAGDVTLKSTVSGDDKKAVAGVLEPKCEWKQHSVVLEGKLSTANVFNVKGTRKNLGTDGLNVSLSADRSVTVVKAEGETSLKVSNSATVGLQFANDKANISTDIKVPIQSAEKLSVAASAHVKPVPNAGVGVKVDWVSGGSVTGEGKIVGGTDQVEGGLTVSWPEKVLGLSVWHSPCAHFQWATSVSHPPSGHKNPTTINVAGNFKVDDYSTVKAKLVAGIDRSDKAERSFHAHVSLQQKVNPTTTVSVGADVNLNQAFGVGSGKGGDPSSWGFQVAFK